MEQSERVTSHGAPSSLLGRTVNQRTMSPSGRNKTASRYLLRHNTSTCSKARMGPLYFHMAWRDEQLYSLSIFLNTFSGHQFTISLNLGRRGLLKHNACLCLSKTSNMISLLGRAHKRTCKINSVNGDFFLGWTFYWNELIIKLYKRPNSLWSNWKFSGK